MGFGIVVDQVGISMKETNDFFTVFEKDTAAALITACVGAGPPENTMPTRLIFVSLMVNLRPCDECAGL